MEKIHIAGFKSIYNMTLTLNPINILIGANGSGKSNFLSFFEFLKQIYSRNLQEYVALKGGLDKFLFEGRKETPSLSAHLYFSKASGYSFTLKSGDDEFIFSEEGLWYNDNNKDISNFKSESNLYFNDSYRSNYIKKYIESLAKYHFHDTSANSSFTKISNIEKDIFRLYPDGHNLAAFLYQIRKTDAITYKLIIKTIQSIAPYFMDFHLNPNDNGDLRLLWQDKFSDVVYSVNDLSDGTKRFIALTVLFMQPKLPQTIIIDEPELGLHPAAITKLAGMIKSVSKKDCQVIIATQSTDLISQF